ncbi:COG2426 family protein [Archaeoglobus fulgidus]|uniref:Small multidrug export protein (QacE) n=2 Tax=Archaeoglobus fulgidus TaxID=2234 RepID=A0A117KLK5_ARCFL|nr:COG2426 family protein [Archaeoglobus fulgidus]AIG98696.1 putative membrane protein [Archaeoglobus fulgidus DSM 8774]KUJ92878.1 MAG: Small multidrug export protein (QacE) [Archaeoglobus fulgidus]KUK06158.1 MAG: Small multidrug export protein (QacE) [Archaeoglobus fulgidus]
MDFNLLSVLLVSAMPFSELRGAIPLALYFGFSPAEAYLLSVLGNILPVPFLLLFLDYLVRIATKVELLARVYRRVVERVERRKGVVERYGYLGLTIFVAIPLPVTGAWTGTLLAFLLQLNRVKAFLFISAGVCIAGVVVLLASIGIIRLL